MPIHRGEDKPLLVSIFEGKGCASKGSDDETYVDTKYGRPAAMKRWKDMDYGGQNRAKSFMAGAVSVIKRWPDHITLCFIIAIIFCLVIVTGILMMGSLKIGSNRPFSAISLQQKCMIRHKALMKSTRNEYPENTNVYLHVTLNDDETFNMEKYDDIFSSVGQQHPNHIINIYVLHNDTLELDYNRNIRFKDWEVYHNQFDQPNFFDTSSAEEDNGNLATVEAKNRNIGHTEYKNVKIIRSTFSNYFRHSPLRYRWRIIPPEMIPFVLRVLTLWEHGGITMPWQLFLDKTDIYCRNKDETDKFQDIVKDMKNNFAILEKTTVFTPLDRQLLIEDIQRFVDIRGSLSIEYDSLLSKETVTKSTTQSNIISESNIENENTLQIQPPKDYDDLSTVKNDSLEDESSETPSSIESVVDIEQADDIEEKMQRITDKMKDKRTRKEKTSDRIAVEEVTSSSGETPSSLESIADMEQADDIDEKMQRMTDKMKDKRTRKEKTSYKIAVEEESPSSGETPVSLETVADMEQANVIDEKMQRMTDKMKDKRTRKDKNADRIAVEVESFSSGETPASLESVIVNEAANDIDEKMQRETEKMKDKRNRMEKTADRIAVEVESSIKSPNNLNQVDDAFKEQIMYGDLNEFQKLSKKEKQRVLEKLKEMIPQMNEDMVDYNDVTPSISQETTTKRKSNRVPVTERTPPDNKIEMKRMQDKLKIREKEKNNARENDDRRRVKRDLGQNNMVIEILPEESKSFHDEKPSYIPESLYEYSDSSYYIDTSNSEDDVSDLEEDASDSEYNSYDYSESYSGLNAPKVFKTNLGRNLNELKHQLSESYSGSSYESIENTAKGISDSVSDKSRNYFREQIAYVKYPVFSNMNVFSIPTKLNLVLDRHGYYFSAKKPCHAFLGHMISALQSDYELKDVDGFVNDGLGSFCRGRKYNNCPGISLL